VLRLWVQVVTVNDRRDCSQALDKGASKIIIAAESPIVLIVCIASSFPWASINLQEMCPSAMQINCDCRSESHHMVMRGAMSKKMTFQSRCDHIMLVHSQTTNNRSSSFILFLTKKMLFQSIVKINIATMCYVHGFDCFSQSRYLLEKIHIARCPSEAIRLQLWTHLKVILFISLLVPLDSSSNTFFKRYA
jgi:hypothetical protein